MIRESVLALAERCSGGRKCGSARRDTDEAFQSPREDVT
jgi:hypothetical protein